MLLSVNGTSLPWHLMCKGDLVRSIGVSFLHPATVYIGWVHSAKSLRNFLFGTSDVFTSGPGVLVRFSWMVILSFTGGHWRGLCSVLVHFLFYSCFSIQRSPVIMFYSLWLKNAIWFLFQHFPIVGPPALLAILRLTSHHPASLVNVFNRQQLISSC